MKTIDSGNKYITVILMLCLILILAACGAEKEAEYSSIDFFAMDTVMNVTAYGAPQELVDSFAGFASELENRLSTTVETSDISVLNSTGTAVLSENTAFVLKNALKYCDLTEGALDITVYPVVKAWGFTTDNYRVPDKKEICGLLEHVDHRLVSIAADNTASVPPGMQIDLGSVAKGYCSDCISQTLKEAGIKSALINLGGNVQTVGSKPDGSNWNIGIKQPQGDGLIGTVSVSDAAVISSGGYERFFTDENGIVRWHIIDPASGYPADSGLVSATAVGGSGMYCDALSTALFVMGEEKAAEFWRQRGDFEMILVTDDGYLVISEGLSDSFIPDSRYMFRKRVVGK